MTREFWSSRVAFIFATTGAAVGLGNIWKFPYMAGANGGSSFVILYLFFVLIIGLPIMLAELVIGRHGHNNAVSTLAHAAKESNVSTRWQYLGWWGAATLLLIFSFYSVVGGWSLAYLFHASVGQFNGLTAQQVTQHWYDFLNHPGRLLLWDSSFIVLTLGIVALGVRRGIERMSDILMPSLFVILFLLVGYSFFTGDFAKACNFLFSFDYHKLTPTIIIAALGHAFFSLAIGPGCILVYGSYAKDNVRLFSNAMIIVLLNVLVALLAGLAIYPLIFKHHLAVAGGPGLIFQSLPIIFASIPGGQVLGGAFFALLFFAAWTSAFSLVEPIIAIFIEKWSLSRRAAAIMIGIAGWALSIGSVLSFNVWKDVHIVSHYNFFGGITDLVTNFLLPLGGMGFAIFASWRMRESISKQEFGHSRFVYPAWRFLCRYIAPLGILVIIGHVLLK